MRFRARKREEEKEKKILHRMRRQAQAGVGMRIKAMRRVRGWSQNELARRCRMPRELLGAIERGNSNFRLDSLLPIVKGLNTTVAELFVGIA
jgi:transcriptional regulator with XRE-family HTH domain